MKWTFRRRTGHPPARSLVGSVLVHGAVGVLALLAGMNAPEPLNFITFEVEIVSPPPVQEEPSSTDDLVVERPEEAPPEEPAEDDVPLPESEPDPEPEPEREPEQVTDDPEPEPEPEEEGELSGEDIEVRMEGVRRDFPEYYENIIRQIQRCFRPSAGLPGGLRTSVYFVIRPDGTVADLEFVERSGNFDFDFEALGAVGDCAGNGRFGPLPEDLPYERLPIIFEFRPPGADLPLSSPPNEIQAGTES